MRKGQNKVQKMLLLILTLWHKKKKRRKYETLTHAFTKRTGGKTNQNKKNK